MSPTTNAVQRVTRMGWTRFHVSFLVTVQLSNLSLLLKGRENSSSSSREIWRSSKVGRTVGRIRETLNRCKVVSCDSVCWTESDSKSDGMDVVRVSDNTQSPTVGPVIAVGDA